jgi:hypothetical protein
VAHLETVKLPEGKILIPGVIDDKTNFVEHPELVAERILNYARLVGRENVIAGVDCGFGTGATLCHRCHPSVVWAKLKALAEGAQLASKQLEDAHDRRGQLTYASAIVDRALEHVRADTERWPHVLNSLRVITTTQRDKALTLLDNVAKGGAPVDVKAAL